MKTQFYARKQNAKQLNNAKQENTQLKTCYLEGFKLDVSEGEASRHLEPLKTHSPSNAQLIH